MRTFCGLIFVAVLGVSSFQIRAAETVRIALIDALSGPYADI